ncbi:MAG: TetR family transcriptional regulator [Coleofasciculaceae cyanobacterium]
MTTYSLSSILLPAVFVSSAVFSCLTIPFALIKTEPVAVEFPPFFSGEIQPIFNGEHKDVAIPYIGFAIVSSVGAGIATVEVNRRWHAYRESLLIQSEPEESQSVEVQEVIELPEYRPEISEIDLSGKEDNFWSQELSVPSSLTEQLISTEETQDSIDLTKLVTSSQDSMAASIAANFNLSLEEPKNSDDLLANGSKSTTETVQNLNSNFTKILDLCQEYQTCRIKVPHLKQSLFAIIVNGKYYSFLRTESSQERTLEIISKLSHKLENMVVTNTEKGYAIWNFEPEILTRI